MSDPGALLLSGLPKLSSDVGGGIEELLVGLESHTACTHALFTLF